MDWLPLRGRDVTLWPDADPEGVAAMAALAGILHGLSAAVSVVTPPADVPKGWDLADAQWSPEQAARELEQRATPWEPSTCKPDLPVAPQVDWEAVAADQAMTIALLRAEKIENGTDPEAIEAAYMLGRRDGMEAERARSSAEIERLRAALTMTPSEPTDEDISWAKQAKEAGNG